MMRQVYLNVCNLDCFPIVSGYIFKKLMVYVAEVVVKCPLGGIKTSTVGV
jgi:hypothetical protein